MDAEFRTISAGGTAALPLREHPARRTVATKARLLLGSVPLYEAWVETSGTAGQEEAAREGHEQRAKHGVALAATKIEASSDGSPKVNTRRPRTNHDLPVGCGVLGRELGGHETI